MMSAVGRGSTGKAMRMFLFGDMGDPKVFGSELGGGGEVSWQGEIVKVQGLKGATCTSCSRGVAQVQWVAP